MSEKKDTVVFGLHVTIDAYNCSPEALNDKQLVYKILDELPEVIGMKKLMKPHVLFAQANDKKDPGGWSGFVMIQESHISLHTFIRRRFITADVYSCKLFDAQMAIDYFIKAFGTTDVETHIEQRGTRYPIENID